MATDKMLSSEYRGHIIEIAFSEEPGGRWHGDWAVFERQPFLAVGAGMLTFPGESRAVAEETAWRSAAAWVDHYIIDESDPPRSPSPGESS